MKRMWVLSAALLVSGGLPARAVTINLLDPGSRLLWNTGVTSTGALGSNASTDLHYFVGSASSTYVVTSSKPSGWRSNISTNDGGTPYDDRTAWISQAKPGTAAFNSVPSGTYTFYTTFTLPASAPFWDVTMTAYVWADNRPDAIRLYDPVSRLALVTVTPPVPPGVSPPPDGVGRYGFVGPGSGGTNPSYSGGPNTISYSGLVAGRAYQIQFDVYNRTLSGTNNSGLWVQWVLGDAVGVPEPAAYAMMGTVGLALLLLRRRRAHAGS